jgi:hypothetical protein
MPKAFRPEPHVNNPSFFRLKTDRKSSLVLLHHAALRVPLDSTRITLRLGVLARAPNPAYAGTPPHVGGVSDRSAVDRANTAEGNPL